MSWNRTYRPKQVKDLHLTTVREYFLSLLKTGEFPQVFLFAGPKGTGKTSTARIIGALLNDPANEEAVKNLFFSKTKNTRPLVEPTLDNEITQRIFAGSSYVVNELDAASNRGIDDVRALRERVGLPPQEGLVTVYILDEVHMLTSEAFNALLKLLEEPPPHVVFILATTELDKIPATIASRCQVIRFTKATPAELTSSLTTILEQEKLTAEKEVLEAVAERADGSFRDAVKLLEMVAQVGALTQEAAFKILNLSLKTQAEELIAALLQKDEVAVVKTFESLREIQVDAKQLHSQLLTYLHNQLLGALGVTPQPAVLAQKTTTFLLKELSSAALSAPSPIPLLHLELKFLEVIERSQKKASPAEPSGPATKVQITKKTIETTEEITIPTKSAHSKPATAKMTETQFEETIGSVNETSGSVTEKAESVEEKLTTASILKKPDTVTADFTGNGQLLCDRWQDIIVQAMSFNFGLATLLKAAKPVSGEPGKLTISVYYKFHQEQLMQPKFMKLIDTLFATIAGGTVELECLLSEEPTNAELKDAAVASENLTQLAVASLM